MISTIVTRWTVIFGRISKEILVEETAGITEKIILGEKLNRRWPGRTFARRLQDSRTPGFGGSLAISAPGSFVRLTNKMSDAYLPLSKAVSSTKGNPLPNGFQFSGSGGAGGDGGGPFDCPNSRPQTLAD
ncbi:uncharacterized protein LDX57_006752 [Aspergillus melleus]|uniref:uncharacterized protein n=1 Tax=Aspergillus melleus TaxID=138277 RepID=UPI001E8E51B1|nr:uncharacterized protein LDX57_006752 [Aspergillus melleus]KAH8429082.1 hypothetical protein LDX57_006752 [Aspergillus melleus]